MNSDDSTILYRILTRFKKLNGCLIDRQLGCLSYLIKSKTLDTSFIVSVDMQPPWGYRVVVTPVREIIVTDDLIVSKMIEYVANMNDVLSGLSRLNFNLETGVVTSVCHMFYDEPPTDEELTASLIDPIELFRATLISLRMIECGDFSPLDG